MKRTVTLATVLGLLLVMALALPIFAQGGPAGAGAPGVNCPNGEFVDANGDGLCDNAAQDGTGVQYGRRSGGLAAAGQGQDRMDGSGAGHVDGNGDGICDNFVDADGDGVCDNCSQQMNRQGQGRMGRNHAGGGMRMGQGPGQ